MAPATLCARSYGHYVCHVCYRYGRAAYYVDIDNFGYIHSATTKSAVMTVQPATTTPYLSGVQTQDPNLLYVTAGTSVPGLVVLSGNATGGGVTVNLASSNTAALTVPSSVKVTKPNHTQSFTITTKNVAAPTDVVITATATGTVATYHVLVLPPNGVSLHNFQGVYISPSFYASGSAAGRVLNIGIVNLTGPAPAGGLTVGISGSRPNIISLVDASGTPTGTITIPAGVSWANIYAVVYPFTGIDHGTIITATLGSVTKSSPEPYLTITALQPQAQLTRTAAVRCASLALVPCLSSIAAVQPSPQAVGDTTGYDLYTPELRLLAETEITAASTKSIAYSYLWFGDLLVASIEAATNTTRWYATDHLGTPYIMTDSAGGSVWRAEYAPYGSVFALRTGAALHQPLRFPGQIVQDGTETYYNVFRHYRSSWGRYSQPDPLGFRDGSNRFAYVHSNPVKFVDPTGLIRVVNTYPSDVMATVVCDGDGNAVPFIGPRFYNSQEQRDCLNESGLMHEQAHVNYFNIHADAVCRGKGRLLMVVADTQAEKTASLNRCVAVDHQPVNGMTMLEQFK